MKRFILFLPLIFTFMSSANASWPIKKLKIECESAIYNSMICDFKGGCTSGVNSGPITLIPNENQEYSITAYKSRIYQLNLSTTTTDGKYKRLKTMSFPVDACIVMAINN